MQQLERKSVEPLLSKQQWPVISLYMPVSRTGDPQDAIRFKNLLGQVEEQLVEGGMRPADAGRLLKDEQALAADADFWKHAGTQGLALFRNGDGGQRHLLPLPFRELVQVGDRFLIKPLLPLLEEKRYYFLCLSKGGVRLFLGERFSFVERDLPDGVPAGLQETLKYDDPERQLQYHSKTPAQADRRGAIFHGQGVGIDEEKSNLKRYAQDIDRALSPSLEEEGLPVVLGAPDELQGIYRSVSRCRHLLSNGVAKNCHDLTETELHDHSWKIAAAYYAGEEKAFEEKFAEKLGTGLALEALPEVLKAAYEGRVGVLFAAADSEVWGVFREDRLETMVVERNEAPTVDLVDEAIFWTMARGGRVLARSREGMPSDSEVCALLRY